MARKETQPTTELGKQLEKERTNRGLTKEEWCVELAISKGKPINPPADEPPPFEPPPDDVVVF